jgi:hypothetical protein
MIWSFPIEHKWCVVWGSTSSPQCQLSSSLPAPLSAPQRLPKHGKAEKIADRARFRPPLDAISTSSVFNSPLPCHHWSR